MLTKNYSDLNLHGHIGNDSSSPPRQLRASSLTLNFEKLQPKILNPGTPTSLLSSSLQSPTQELPSNNPGIIENSIMKTNFFPPEIVYAIAQFAVTHAPEDLAQHALVNSTFHGVFQPLLEKTVVVQMHELSQLLQLLTKRARENRPLHVEKLFVVFSIHQAERHYWGRNYLLETVETTAPYTVKDCTNRAWQEFTNFVNLVKSNKLLPWLRLVAIHGHDNVALTKRDAFDLFTNLTVTPKTNLFLTYHFPAEVFAKRKRLGDRRPLVDWGVTYSLDHVPWPEDAQLLFPDALREDIRCLHLGQIHGWELERSSGQLCQSLPETDELSNLLQESIKAHAFVNHFREADMILPNLSDIRAQSDLLDVAKGGDLQRIVDQEAQETLATFSDTHVEIIHHVQRLKRRIREEVYAKIIGILCSANLRPDEEMLELWT